MARIHWVTGLAVVGAVAGGALVRSGHGGLGGLFLALSAALLVGGVALGSASPRWQLFGPAILAGRPGGRAVALTFDDGPHEASTEALLSALEAAGARATFFLLPEQVRAVPELARRIAERHEVGLHGIAHDTSLVWMAPALGAERIRAEVAALSEVIGQPIRWFRPPFGVTSPRLVEAVERAGLVTVWCSVRTYDGVGSDPQTLLERCRRIDDGDIVLMHEGDRPARLVLSEVLRILEDRGLRCVTVSELVGP